MDKLYGCVAKTGVELVNILTEDFVSPELPRSWTPSIRLNGVTAKKKSSCYVWSGYLRYPLSYRNLEEMMLERGWQ